MPARALLRLPALQGRVFYNRLLTPLVTLWLLLFQRLNPDHTLEAALTHAQNGGADRLQPKLSRDLHSTSTGPYSEARRRLPVDFLRQALQGLGEKISRWDPNALWQGWRLVLLDGSTVRLRSYGDIPKEFPPHRNQHATSYWCLMRVVVGFCACTGAALDCALGSMHLSEQALACQIIARAAAGCLFIGDRNFGIFLIAQAACAQGQEVLLRLTEMRAAKLLGGKLRLGDHPVAWQATHQSQRLAELSPQPIAGRLLVVQLHRRGFRSFRLCLFTTLSDSARYPLAELVQLYGRRWLVELNLRYVKAQMDSAQLETHGAEMAGKEWLASLMAYNLVRAAMLCAALHAQIPPLNLSFSACRRRLERWLQDLGSRQPPTCAQWEKLLDQLGRCRLPKRRKARPAEPRAQRQVWRSFPPLRGSRAAARRKLQKSRPKS